MSDAGSWTLHWFMVKADTIALVFFALRASMRVQVHGATQWPTLDEINLPSGLRGTYSDIKTCDTIYVFVLDFVRACSNDLYWQNNGQSAAGSGEPAGKMQLWHF